MASLALLVVAVDCSLYCRDAIVADIGTAGDVLLVPEQIVEFVLPAYKLVKPGVRVGDFLAMPAVDRLLLQLRDFADVNHRRWSRLAGCDPST